MDRKTRLWVGITLIAVILFNYAMVGYPIIKRSMSLKAKADEIIMSKSADDEYFVELLRKERMATEKKLMVLNCIAATLLVIAASWTAFGLAVHKKR